MKNKANLAIELSLILKTTAGDIYNWQGFNILKLDDILHKRHGEYDGDNGCSMGELIKREYGERAYNLCKEIMK